MTGRSLRSTVNESGNNMRILTYKATHVGDPGPDGRFGTHDCMGRVRGYAYDAVIGVGGVAKDARIFGIDRKVHLGRHQSHKG